MNTIIHITALMQEALFNTKTPNQKITRLVGKKNSTDVTAVIQAKLGVSKGICK